jgi:hypothetical protein
MAKRNPPTQEKETVLTAKQIGRSRRERKARRQIMIASGVLTAIVVVILGVGLVNELIVKPGQPVATVGDIEISTADFQDRVRLERGQTISLILQYAELLGVEQVYGIAAQLDEYETIGEQVLDNMVSEVLIRRAADQIPGGILSQRHAHSIANLHPLAVPNAHHCHRHAPHTVPLHHTSPVPNCGHAGRI